MVLFWKKREGILFGRLKDDTFSFEHISSYFNKRDKGNPFQVISERTCNDLDFNELFMFLDRTSSKIGQQYLYDRLRVVEHSNEDVKKQEDYCKFFQSNPQAKKRLLDGLNKLNRNEAYHISTLFLDKHLKPPEWFYVVRLMSLTSVIVLLLTLIYPKYFALMILIFVVNIALHYWNKRNLNQYIDSIPQLMRMNRLAKEMLFQEELSTINQDLKESVKAVDEMKRRMFFVSMEARLDNDLQSMLWVVSELVKAYFLIEPIMFFNFLKCLGSKREMIHRVFRFVGAVDCALSVGFLRENLPFWCLPKEADGLKELSFSGIYHPLVPECVENSIELKGKSVLITGSNMSGKTTFIRTVGINLLAAQTLNTCFARAFHAPKMSIHSAIRITDDLLNSKSYYFEEVLTIKEMIMQSQNKGCNLFLLDEIFKGTNTIERVSAGKAVLSELNKNDNIVFVSTHDIELAELLEKDYELYHFSETVGNNNVNFDFKLKQGMLKTRNAIKILEINGYPSEVISEALNISRLLDYPTKING